MAKKNYEEMSKQILDCVGGKENVSFFAHCVTRLRFNVRDKSRIKEDELKKITGVLGIQWSGEQLQIIVGQAVDEIYSCICKIGGFVAEKAIDENLDNLETEKITPKAIFNKAVSYLSTTMIQILPIIFVGGMCKSINSLFGPDLFNLFGTDSDLYIMFDFLYDAVYYFLPIYLGYSACKTLKIDSIYGIFLGCLIIVPDFMAMVGVRDSFTIFGIPCMVAGYQQSFLPVVLGVPICKIVLNFMKKITPSVLRTLIVPLCTVLIMVPIMFCITCPFGTYVGDVLGNIFIWMSNQNYIIRALGCALLGIAFPFLIMGGMHALVVNVAAMAWLELGYETFVFPPITAYSWAVYGLPLGVFLKAKSKDKKGDALSCFVSGFIGGVSEPTIYGIALRYKGALKALLIVCGIGGLYCGIFQPKAYLVGNILNIFSAATTWTGGTNENLISGLLLCIISFVLAAILGYFMTDCNDEKEKKGV